MRSRFTIYIKSIVLPLILLLIFSLPVLAQEFSFSKAKDDYIFTEDNYKESLNNFNSKKDSYQKNPTLSLKEEARLALFKFLDDRNNFIKSYLTLIRMKAVESEGLNIVDKQNIFSKVDPEVEWYNKRKEAYKQTDTLEDLVNKSKEEDSRYKTDTLPIIYYSLSNISLGDIIALKNNHLEIYRVLKTDSDNLVKLGRADSSLFDRWYRDIDGELTKIDQVEKVARKETEKILSKESYEKNRSYLSVIEVLEPSKTSLLKINQFVKELETAIQTKR